VGLHCREKRAGYCCGVPEEDKRETADAFMRSAELEFAAERARWERDRAKHRLIRLLSFSFLSLVVLGGLVALFLVLSRANEVRRARPSRPAPSPQSSP
jgi:hypothetical protein